MDRPNPGSFEAQQMGCSCPSLENQGGKGYKTSDSGVQHFWFDGNCPVHCPQSPEVGPYRPKLHHTRSSLGET